MGPSIDQAGEAVVNIALWLEASARSSPSAPALLDGTTVVANNEEFAGRAASIAAAALKDRHGIAPGDRVAVFIAGGGLPTHHGLSRSHGSRDAAIDPDHPPPAVLGARCLSFHAFPEAVMRAMIASRPTRC